MSESGPPERRPSGAPEIPEILRERPRPADETQPKTMTSLARGLALGWDLVGSIAAGLLLGVLVDRWLGSSPVGVLVGLGLGMSASLWRLLRQSSRDSSGGSGGRGAR